MARRDFPSVKAAKFFIKKNDLDPVKTKIEMDGGIWADVPDSLAPPPPPPPAEEGEADSSDLHAADLNAAEFDNEEADNEEPRTPNTPELDRHRLSAILRNGERLVEHIKRTVKHSSPELDGWGREVRQFMVENGL